MFIEGRKRVVIFRYEINEAKKIKLCVPKTFDYESFTKLFRKNFPKMRA